MEKNYVLFAKVIDELYDDYIKNWASAEETALPEVSNSRLIDISNTLRDIAMLPSCEHLTITKSNMVDKLLVDLVLYKINLQGRK